MKNKIERNPLAIAFGLFMNERRNDTPIEPISQALSITSSYYRMIEAGKVNLNSSKTLNLLELEMCDDIRFEQLSRLFIILSITDQCSTAIEYEKAIELLIDSSDYTNDISLLFKSFSKYFDKFTDVNYLELASVLNLQKDLIRFLTKLPNTEFHAEIHEKATQLSNAPSLYLEPVQDLIESFDYTPKSILVEESGIWEEKHKHKFSKLTLVCRDSGSLLDSVNFQHFNYEFISFDTFSSARIILLDDIEHRDFRIKFKEFLRTAYHAKKEKERISSFFDEKFQIIKINDSQKESLTNIIQHDGLELEMMWIYELINYRKIGFYRRPSERKQFNGIIMSLGETLEKYEQVEEIINEIQ